MMIIHNDNGDVTKLNCWIAQYLCKICTDNYGKKFLTKKEDISLNPQI